MTALVISPQQPAVDQDATLAVGNGNEENGGRMEDLCRLRVIDTVDDAFVAFNAEGTILEWNASAERTFGWSRAEVLGGDLAGTIIPPSSRQAHRDWRRLFADGSGTAPARRLELSALHRDGHEIPAEITVWQIHGEGSRRFHAFVRDLTERRQSEAERRRLTAIIDSCDEAIVGVGLDLEIITWNRGAEGLYGYSAAEALGQPLTLVTRDAERAQVKRLVERVRRGKPVHQHETKAVRKNGVVLDVSVTISPACDRDGELAGFSVIARDITEQRWMAATLTRTLKSLEQALADARKSEDRCRRFTADAAHQLRTPLAGIRAAAETLLRDPSCEARDALLYNVVRETARAGRLMTGLLQLARVDQGQALAPKKCDVVRLCTEEVDRARMLAAHLAVEVVADQAPATAPELDDHAVREILTNLIDNARRHAASRIQVVVGTDGDKVELKVVDDGPGVPPSMVERIFDRFVSGDGKGGSGLGLAIARGLAQTHGGDLTYEDRVFVLRLPMKVERDCGGAGQPDFARVEQAVDDWGPWLSN